MSTKTKIAAVAVAALTLAGSMAVTSNEAQARGGRGALLFGAIVAGTLIGAAAANSYYEPAYGYRRCHWVPRYNSYGDYIGRDRICDAY